MKKLSEIKEGCSGTVKEINGDNRFLTRVTSIGITVGCEVTILKNENKQPILLYGRDTMVALNRKECEKIEMEER